MPRRVDAEPADESPGVIPSRNTEWETPFSPVAPVNADLDATREVGIYSAARRKVAIALSALALLIVAANIVILVIATAKAGYTDERRILIVYYIGMLILIVLMGSGLVATWKWANEPVNKDESWS